MNPGSLRAGLVAAAIAAASHARDPWWVIGNAAVVLHGADPDHVADIDLLTSARHARSRLDAAGTFPPMLRATAAASARSMGAGPPVA